MCHSLFLIHIVNIIVHLFPPCLCHTYLFLTLSVWNRDSIFWEGCRYGYHIYFNGDSISCCWVLVFSGDIFLTPLLIGNYCLEGAYFNLLYTWVKPCLVFINYAVTQGDTTRKIVLSLTYLGQNQTLDSCLPDWCFYPKSRLPVFDFYNTFLHMYSKTVLIYTA